MCKYLKGYSPDITNGIFRLRKNVYNPRHFHTFQTENSRSLKYGLDAFQYRVSHLWQLVLIGIREDCSLVLLKDRIKN